MSRSSMLTIFRGTIYSYSKRNNYNYSNKYSSLTQCSPFLGNKWDRLIGKLCSEMIQGFNLLVLMVV